MRPARSLRGAALASPDLDLDARSATFARVLLRPRWLVGHVIVITLACLFVAAGFWQLHRNTQKHDKVAAARVTYLAPAPSLTSRPAPRPGERAEVSGTYDAAHEALLRGQVRGAKVG